MNRKPGLEDIHTEEIDVRTGQNVIIADLDGTISLVDHRRHFVEGEKKDWQAFYQACIEDGANQPVIELLDRMSRDGFIINIFSGREESVRKQTEFWLHNEFVPYDSLLMRPTGDYTPDDQLKRDWLYLNADLKDKVLFVLDDRQKVVDMWRQEGLTCFQVAKGDF